MAATHHNAPGKLARTSNAVVAALLRLHVPLFGARVLAVRGRTSGEWRTVPVNPIDVDGVRYLVSPRGQTQWVRNLRAAGECELRRGRSAWQYAAVEVADVDKPAILRAYLARWEWQVRPYVNGSTADSTDAELLTAAQRHPVFRLADQPRT
ncbi:nitroreductase/quinone reductase family protein [Haloechinothrix halophila]|uniref:nitroreductase/quinone reductase family protein n=1 Tax=Haloechinothrix halophila TaxID=1069073 RepID=UPI000425AD8E|nr:nitroreductase/quinone reductase family protein [Haloechinothrix halophila]